MTTYTESWVECDLCHATVYARTQTEARQEARALGWVKRERHGKTYDICPRCLERWRQEQVPA